MGAAAVVGTVRDTGYEYIHREWALSAWGPRSVRPPRPQPRRAPASKARRQVKVACRQLVYSCFYIVAIGATRLQEVSYILAKISDVD